MLYLDVKYLGQPPVAQHHMCEGEDEKRACCFTGKLHKFCTHSSQVIAVVCSFFEEVDNLCGLEFAAMHRPQWAEK